MKRDVVDISETFEEIEKNIRFVMDRRNSHTGIINDIISSIQQMTFFKIAIVVVVSLMQVFLIKRFLASGRKITYGGQNEFYGGNIGL